jgi:hypothetical protein
MKVKSKDKQIDKSVGWSSALAEARRQLATVQARSRTLRRSVALIEEKIKEGEPWPGALSEGQDSSCAGR